MWISVKPFTRTHWRGIFFMKTSNRESNSRSPWQSSTFLYKARFDRTLKYWVEALKCKAEGRLTPRSSPVPDLYPDLYLTPNMIALSWDSLRCDKTNLQYNSYSVEMMHFHIQLSTSSSCQALRNLSTSLCSSLRCFSIPPFFSCSVSGWMTVPLFTWSPSVYFPTLVLCLGLCFCAMP